MAGCSPADRSPRMCRYAGPSGRSHQRSWPTGAKPKTRKRSTRRSWLARSRRDYLPPTHGAITASAAGEPEHSGGHREALAGPRAPEESSAVSRDTRCRRLKITAWSRSDAVRPRGFSECLPERAAAPRRKEFSLWRRFSRQMAPFSSALPLCLCSGGNLLRSGPLCANR